MAEEDGLASRIAPVFVEKAYTVLDGKVWHVTDLVPQDLYSVLSRGRRMF
jgi:hypothetical protein